MTLFYILKSGRPFCEGCGEFMSGVFFTCVKCFDDHSRSCYSVCLKCCESTDIVHEHQEFLDNFALLEAKRRKSEFPALRATAAQVQTLRKDSNPRGQMKELRQIATIYDCRSTSEDIKEKKEKIRKFFSPMRYGDHEPVALHEFLDFMRRKDNEHLTNNSLDLEFMNTPEFFKKLDRDKKGLNISDLETLYYIIQSGRPFCKGCGEFIEGMFFTCVTCFERCSTCFECGGTCFSLCLHCYNAKKFIHEHDLFLDNYALLEAMRETAKKTNRRKTHVKVNDSKQSASLAMLLKIDTSEGSTSSPGPIVPLNNKLPNFTTKPNTSSLGPIVPVINKPSTTKAITSSDHSLVKVIKKDTFLTNLFVILS
ncbi:uncharacterized protein LOC117913913 isoform X2 [Vitis riparia]|uniref:uncharacterized protein LOC117913913 isoform X2 n=1 Tax=Vitis riparia TaxID=96939 RepID=UPI00155A4081|nr:uncharacterized protein LOC117913913 isoform X2 [Vitis riparia]